MNLSAMVTTPTACQPRSSVARLWSVLGCSSPLEAVDSVAFCWKAFSRGGALRSVCCMRPAEVLQAMRVAGLQGRSGRVRRVVKGCDDPQMIGEMRRLGNGREGRI